MAQSLKERVVDLGKRGAQRWLTNQFGENDNGQGFLGRQATAILENEAVQEKAEVYIGQGLDLVAAQMKQDAVHHAKAKGEALGEAAETYGYIYNSLVVPGDGWFTKFKKSILAGILWCGSRITSVVVATYVDKWAYAHQQDDNQKEEQQTYEPYLIRVFNKWCTDLFSNKQQPATA